MSRLSTEVLSDAEVLWGFNVIAQEPVPADACLGLGSHDLGVATHCAKLYLAGFAKLVVFTGANAPTTIERFPRGEAVHYAEEATRMGVPAADIIVEPRARNTRENIAFSRELLSERGVEVRSLLLVTRPYQLRRARATLEALWPNVTVIPTSSDTGFAEYLDEIGDAEKVVHMLVGDTQRVIEYPKQGFAASQDVPSFVVEAMYRLIRLGFTRRLIPGFEP